MKFKKVILSKETLGLVKDRLNKITSVGIFSTEVSWGDSNPLRNDLDYSVARRGVYMNKTTTVHHLAKKINAKDAKSFKERIPLICIPSDHRCHVDTFFSNGDVVLLGKDEIRIKTLSFGRNKLCVEKIKLLTRDVNDPVFKEQCLETEEYLMESDEYHDEYFKRQEEEWLEEIL